MKHIFLINPDAGRGKAEKELLPKILRAVKGKGLDYEIHRAMTLESGRGFVRSRCESGQPVRFYACGGDGTLNGLLSGVYGFSNAELACVPVGSGNDFVRNFKNKKHFLNIERQLNGKAVPVDVLRYNDRYALNMLNIGLDCTVVSKAADLKRTLIFGRGGAYMGGAAKALMEGAHFPLHMEFEGGEVLQDDFLLLAMGNGGFCGGGFQAAPRAKLQDGFFDVCIVKQLDRRRILPLLRKYRSGLHLEDEECRRHVIYKQCKRMTILPEREGERLSVSVDGDVSAYDSVTVELIPEAVRFSIPEGAEPIR